MGIGSIAVRGDYRGSVLIMWTIALTKAESGPVEPLFYYNHTYDVWQRNLDAGAIFMDERKCLEMYDQLNIFGADKLTVQIKMR